MTLISKQEVQGRDISVLVQQTQYRRDSIVVSLRAVSTLTGEVILNVQTSKTVLSSGQAGDVFRFLDMDTKLLELESGMTQNESVTYAVRSAIEAAVLALIKQGDERGYWKIVYPEDWDEQVAEQEQAYWMSQRSVASPTRRMLKHIPKIQIHCHYGREYFLKITRIPNNGINH